MNVPDDPLTTAPRQTTVPPPSPAGAKEHWLEISASRYFPSWLREHNISLALTTYQAGKVIMIGCNADLKLSVLERTFPRCMAVWSDPLASDTLWLSSLYQLWRLEDVADLGHAYPGYDKLYVPRVAYSTGDIDTHDIVVESSGRVLFCNTLFSCLATISQKHSFVPLWKPPFVSKLVPEDRCHLNGVALENGKAAYVTTGSQTDITEGWRDRRQDGGCLIDVRTNEILCNNLSMPHSPRVHDGKLYLHDSGRGNFGYLDREKKQFVPLTFCRGFLRGLAFVDRYAIVALSKPRLKTFAGLELDNQLKQRDADPHCGLQIIDLTTGDIIHWLRIEGAVFELYDVAILRGVVRPMLLGFKTDEIQRLITVDAAGTL